MTLHVYHRLVCLSIAVGCGVGNVAWAILVTGDFARAVERSFFQAGALLAVYIALQSVSVYRVRAVPGDRP
jgi:hypothetical protein